MNFLQVLAKFRGILDLIDKYDEPVRETLKALKWIFDLLGMSQVNDIIDFLCDNEAKLIKYIIDCVELAEETPGISGIEKLNKALQFSHQQFRTVDYPALINKTVNLINSLIKR